VARLKPLELQFGKGNYTALAKCFSTPVGAGQFLKKINASKSQMCDLFPFQTAKNDLRGGPFPAKGLQKNQFCFFSAKNKPKSI
jgi:hypothetical protein